MGIPCKARLTIALSVLALSACVSDGFAQRHQSPREDEFYPITSIPMPAGEVIEPGAIESYAQVHHRVATVEGRLRPEVGPIDVVRAMFPGGSNSGGAFRSARVSI